ncbi:hypothetical protein CLV28_0984 [Sediminihabitans luteus]|uniref:Uncharacterized protein n=2 Tax=Sediminihabitans luteus TaxID=1138585 RepID=A0A2M9D1A3_9CELL|nr:hypothetical protein CLV28_0984 [Sediminihabitans luteus]GIJ00015.1 hypothetical protein Slu03_23920 [Sediminihabitans luteus]
MQKALLPAMVKNYLDGTFDQVAGFVVRAADAREARTPADLFDLFGLGFPGSPFTRDAEHVDMLLYPLTAQLRHEDATGGVDQESRAITGGPFVDRPPFNGTGFTAWSGGIVPLYWLVSSRVPRGSEIHRFTRAGTSRLVARYVDVATGWVSWTDVVEPPGPYISPCTGAITDYRGKMYSADVLENGRVVLAAEEYAGPGFTSTPAGRWRAEVDRAEVGEIFELSMVGVVQGLPVRVIGQWTVQDGTLMYWCTYTGHDADFAEGLGWRKLDAGVYDVFVPATDVDRLQHIQLIPDEWALPSS